MIDVKSLVELAAAAKARAEKADEAAKYADGLGENKVWANSLEILNDFHSRVIADTRSLADAVISLAAELEAVSDGRDALADEVMRLTSEIKTLRESRVELLALAWIIADRPGDGVNAENRHNERLWFSPNCLNPPVSSRRIDLQGQSGATLSRREKWPADDASTPSVGPRELGTAAGST